VLLVEDGPSGARATAELLADGGVEADVAIVSDVEEALACLRSGGVDLLILDLSLPDRQGLELLTAIRSGAWRDLPVVVLSGTTDPDLVQESYQLGANCFVRKPHRIGELVPAVRAIEHFWIRHATAPPVGPPDHAEFQLPLAATPDAVREARAIVRGLLDGWGLASLGDTAVLCTSELATNAVIHAGSPVLLVVALLPSAVRIEVEDAAPGALEPGSLVGDAETGRGLAIVNALTQSWGVDQHPSGKTVWFELLRPDTP